MLPSRHSSFAAPFSPLLPHHHLVSHVHAQQDRALAELKTARAEAAHARDAGAAATAALQAAQTAHTALEHRATAHAARLAADLAQTTAALHAAEARLRAAEPFDAHADAALAAWDVPLDAAGADPAAVARTAPLRAQCVAYQQRLAAAAAALPASEPPASSPPPAAPAAEPSQVPQSQPPAAHQWDAAAEAALLDACREHGVAVSDVCAPSPFPSISLLPLPPSRHTLLALHRTCG